MGGAPLVGGPSPALSPPATAGRCPQPGAPPPDPRASNAGGAGLCPRGAGVRGGGAPSETVKGRGWG
ncbi:hypothetical protein EKH77_22735 [Streptomyces luteoverticillatus]|uniref:Uncharacterized protein n=1 Tax=Streptomyces luteoverticillatus TaxID=66425 RepID=A0A3S9PMS1_STRLT|nr:hypothetical protein EKH77_22735 [Streptomyces luteoverticillatus]